MHNNRKLREKVGNVLTCTWSPGYLDLDEAIVRFYAPRLETVSSVSELVNLVRNRQITDLKFLSFYGRDILYVYHRKCWQRRSSFPNRCRWKNGCCSSTIPAGPPGQENDGIILWVSFAEMERLSPADLDLAASGHLAREEELLLKALPKNQRLILIPLPKTAKAIIVQLFFLVAPLQPPTLL